MLDTESKKFSPGTFFLQWEWLLIFIFIVFNLVMIFTTRYYLDTRNIFDMTFIFTEKGLVAIVMIFIIITGNIDISVASIMGLSSVSMAIIYQAGVNIWTAFLFGIFVGTFCGFLNGLIITRVKLPAMITTLATYSLFRGIAYVILGDQAVSGFTEKFAYLGRGYLGNSPVPFPLLVFVVLTIILGLILHKTTFGRMVYAIGWNENACFASGIPVKKIKLLLFSLSGFMSGLAGMFVTARIGNTRPNIATGFELEIITIVILGGVMITGGVGNMWGVFLSIILVGTIRYGLGLHNIPSQIMVVVTGSLLIGSILLNNIMNRFLAFRVLRK